ncbi:hypothetical protein BH10ACT11_BH10ACT11_07870 [soil metagenome]
MSDPSPLIFVGGTGRSGTHIVAELIGHHPSLHAVPIECRFHSNPKGLADVVTGKHSPADFTSKMRRYWWHRVRHNGRALVRMQWRARGEGDVRGLHKITTEQHFDEALARFEASCDMKAAARVGDPDVLAASRRIFFDLLGPLSAEAGKPGLVEMSCFTIASAEGLQMLFPGAQFIHSVRDGRDSGSSKVSKRQKDHHPTDSASSVDWWAGRLELAERGVRAMSDSSRVHVVSLDELVWGDRERSYTSLCDFLGLGDEPAVRAFFDAQMNAENAHKGRWREGLSEVEQDAISAAYGRALDRIEAEGYHCAVPLRRNFERSHERL